MSNPGAPRSPRAIQPLVVDDLRPTIPGAPLGDDLAGRHRAEIERVFAKSWLYVGHESEIPSPATSFAGRSGGGRSSWSAG